MKYKKKSFDFGYTGKRKKLLPHVLRRCLYGTKKKDRGTRLTFEIFFSQEIKISFFFLLFFYMMTAFQKKKEKGLSLVWETEELKFDFYSSVFGSLPRFLLLANKTPKWHTTRSSPKLLAGNGDRKKSLPDEIKRPTRLESLMPRRLKPPQSRGQKRIEVNPLQRRNPKWDWEGGN